MSIRFAFAIPTLNRRPYLEKLVNSIKSQQLHDGIHVTVVISNSQSTDSTYDYINELLSETGSIRFIAHNAPPKQEQLVPFEKNWKTLSTIIPEDVDWVWTLGDDDFLYEKNALTIVADVISSKTTNNLGFVHACQARRSHSTGKAFSAPLYQLCNNIGFHEMLGWISSNIMLRKYAISALARAYDKIEENYKTDSLGSAYPHSAAILKEAFKREAVFVDLPLVEPQDLNQTKESIARWHRENIGERFLYLIDDLQEISRETEIPNFSRTFFRYLNFNIWDRFILYQFGVLMNDKLTPEQKMSPKFIQKLNNHWKRIASIVDMMDDNHEKKSLSLQIRAAVDLSNLCVTNGFKNPEIYKMIKATANLTSQAVYDFKILQN